LWDKWYCKDMKKFRLLAAATLSTAALGIAAIVIPASASAQELTATSETCRVVLNTDGSPVKYWYCDDSGTARYTELPDGEVLAGDMGHGTQKSFVDVATEMQTIWPAGTPNVGQPALAWTMVDGQNQPTGKYYWWTQTGPTTWTSTDIAPYVQP
jgi:hypothetical protein